MFCLLISLLTFILSGKVVLTKSFPIVKKADVYCNELPQQVLEEILGAAFNARYMSIRSPNHESKSENGKRKTELDLDFYVEDLLLEDFEEKPAWVVKNHVEVNLNSFGVTRAKRDVDYLQEWQCKSRVKWTDLGPDYFPRYLRSVECLSANCWFNIYKCKPRSFSVKVLKRKRGRCVKAEPGTKIGFYGLPRELKELWVWEERAVTFCCDCSMHVEF